MVDQDRERKSHVIKDMIEMLNSKEVSKFHVMLLQYYIEGEPYRASALTVSTDHTPNMHETPDGFECETFFPPELLMPEAQEGKEVVNGVMRVRLKANLEDIVAIIATPEGGPETTLYAPTEGRKSGRK